MYIPISINKLMLGLRVRFISSHLTADKVFLVNPRAITGSPKTSLLLEAKSTHELISKPRLILVAHTGDLRWYITSNQQVQMLFQNLNRIVTKPNVPPGQILYCTTDCISIDLMFQENFSTNTQVWNRPSHRNNCGQRSDLSYPWVLQQQPVLGQKQVIRKSSVKPRAWVGPTTN